MDKYTREYEIHMRKTGKDKTKKKEKEMKSIEQFKQEVEKDLDRRFYCSLIESEIENYIKP